MPTYKPELTLREQGKYLSIARELQATGTTVDIPDEWQENARFEAVTRWDPGVFSCYPHGPTPYRFAPGLHFDVKEVLNDRIERDLRFRRGDIREGWLLAMGNKPVPEEYGPGRPAPVEVRFFDQAWQSQVASSILAVERSTQTRRYSMGPGLGLYEREDPPVSIECGVDPDATVPLRTPPRANTERRARI